VDRDDSGQSPPDADPVRAMRARLMREYASPAAPDHSRKRAPTDDARPEPVPELEEHRQPQAAETVPPEPAPDAVSPEPPVRSWSEDPAPPESRDEALEGTDAAPAMAAGGGGIETGRTEINFAETAAISDFSDLDSADGIAPAKPRKPGLLARLKARLAPVTPVTANVTDKPKLHPAVYVGSFIINILALGMPLVILQVYDRILPNEATDTLLFMIVGLCGVVALDTVMKLARSYVVGFAATQWSQDRVAEALERILAADSDQLEEEAPSIHIERMSAIDALRDFHGGQSRLLLLDLPFVVIFIGLIAFIGGALVAVPLALFAVLGVIIVASGKQLQRVIEQRAANDDKRHDFVIECLAGIYTIKAMAMEPQIQRRYERLQRDAAEATYETIVLGNAAQSFGNMFASLTMISVVTAGALMVINGALTIGTLAACTLLSGRAIQPVLKGLMLWTQMQSLSVSRHRVSELFRLPEAPSRDAAVPLALRGDVTFHNVGIQTEDGARTLFSGLDLSIPAGQFIGIKGPDNTGKSLLLQAVSGEFAPSQGEIRIDGHVVGGPSHHLLQRQIAYVPAQTEIFQGTILENIAMFASGEAIDAARAAAQLIGLEAEIHKLPDGYDTRLSEGITEEIASGMTQQIGIARALARRPRVLLFDEANATLDARSDARLRDGLARLKGAVTVMIVSQRPSFLKIADRRFVTGGATLREETEAVAQDAAAAAEQTAVATVPAAS